MHDIICPHSNKAFKIDEAGYANIFKQVRDGDFDKRSHERLELAERERARNAQQAAAQLADAARQLAVNEAVELVARERDGLKNDPNLITVKNQL